MMFNNIEMKRLHLENRINKLSAKPVENKNLIAKAKRQLEKMI